MEKIEFRCLNCGNCVKKDLLPGKHTILGSIPMVNKEAGCCTNPDYEDNRGYQRSRREKSFRQMVPTLA